MKHGLTGENKRSGLRLNSLSCVALPTCGLALRKVSALPDILSKFEAVLEEAGPTEDAISLRITGCPNGCARPFLAEIGLLAKPRTNMRFILSQLQWHAARAASYRQASRSTMP